MSDPGCKHGDRSGLPLTGPCHPLCRGSCRVGSGPQPGVLCLVPSYPPAASVSIQAPQRWPSVRPCYWWPCPPPTNRGSWHRSSLVRGTSATACSLSGLALILASSICLPYQRSFRLGRSFFNPLVRFNCHFCGERNMRDQAPSFQLTSK